ncbi:putative indole-3-acetic acid-amido synthetase GH3.6 [Tasmannia lanceolata]|uniref:putative indole-3-acetic acid-amido synthetase GH3.6 n=1 Tax=Tasmannia lanceolata TaxID=3420 RepID=UPI004062FFA5
MMEKEILKEIDECTRDAKRLQLETLRAILKHNDNSIYLKSHFNGSDSPIDPDSFRRLVPISSYDDYADHINRMANGDDSPILSVDPLLCFFYSSGTSSLKPKMIPYFDSKQSKASSNLAHQASSATVRRLFPPRPSINKTLWFLYAGNVTETKGGIKVMAASAYPFQNDNPNTSRLLSMCISPAQVLRGSDPQQQMYCHLLCGLRDSNSIDGIRAPYAAGLIRAFRLLESKWGQLCEDIEHGSVTLEITDVTIRNSVEEFLNDPQPNIAKRIRAVCEENKWGGIMSKLWPNLRYVSCVTTGSMEQYYPKLKYYAGDIPLLGGDYFASECAIAINLDRLQPPELTRFVMLPTTAYFEFLPFDTDTGVVAKETVDFSGVEVGMMYEVVVTTYRGLYRYRLGDIVKVVGFYNSSPQIEYVTRAPNASCELVTERDLMSAMESVQVMLRDEALTEVLEFTSFMDLDSSPKHMTIFLEVTGECVFLQSNSEESVIVLRRYCSFLEGCLGSLFKVQRMNGDVGPLELSIVKPGSFDVLLQVALENGAPANQYKPPKILRNHMIAELLKNSAVLTVC